MMSLWMVIPRGSVSRPSPYEKADNVAELLRSKTISAAAQQLKHLPDDWYFIGAIDGRD
jgi:hypothetical protein